MAGLRERLASEQPAKPLSPRRLRAVERELGFELPTFLRDLYGSLGNGGFGPGYGITGLSGGAKDDLGRDVVEDYVLRRGVDADDPGWFWPTAVLAVCHWGCGIYSCIDCRSPEARVLRFDPNPVDEDWSVAWGLEQTDLATWLRRWLDGDEMFESGTPDGSFSVAR